MKTDRAPKKAHGAEYSKREIIEVMSALLAALFTAMISTTIVSTALPTIMADLHGTQQQYTWVITASLLTMTISTPIWGKLSDLFDKKVLTQLALILFVVGSVVAGFSHTVAVMMVARAMQGLAMGGLMSLAQAIMGTIMSPRERGRYAGYMGGVMAVATVSGPLIGGYITESWGWHWCFFVSIPLAVVAFILLQVKLVIAPLPPGRRSIDYLGAVLVTIASALPMLWVTFAGSDFEWVSWQSALYLGGFVVAAIALVIVELRVSEPMIPIRLLKRRTTTLMVIASIGTGVAMFGSGVFLTQYFQLGLGVSALEAGLMTIPLIIAQVVSSTAAGQIVSRTGHVKPTMLVGSVILLGSLTGLATIDHTTQYWTVAIYMVLMGLGVGSLTQNVVLAVQNIVDVREIGAASATIAFFRSLGGAIGVTILGAILTSRVATNIEDGLRELGVPTGASSSGGGTDLNISGLPAPVQTVFHHAYSDAFGQLFLVAAIIVITTVLAVVLMRENVLRTTIGLSNSPSKSPSESSNASPSESTIGAPNRASNASPGGSPKPEGGPGAEVHHGTTESPGSAGGRTVEG